MIVGGLLLLALVLAFAWWAARSRRRTREAEADAAFIAAAFHMPMGARGWAARVGPPPRGRG